MSDQTRTVAILLCLAVLVATLITFISSIAHAAPSVDEMLHDPGLIGRRSCWVGGIFQIHNVKDGGEVILTVPPPYHGGKVPIVIAAHGDHEPIAVGNVVEFCGTFFKLYTYNSTDAGTITAPVIEADSIRRVREGEL